MGIDSVLTGANAGLELGEPRMARVLADQLRGLLYLHRERIRGTGAGPGAVRPGPIAAYLAEWLR